MKVALIILGLVCWLSPNDWYGGSIYGNVQFNFNWTNIIKGMKFYWVEAMHKYRPPAYRILITDSNYSLSKLKPYDPRSGDGPIFHDVNKNIWYRNGHYTGEFLIDRNLSLDECTNIESVTHNKRGCRRYGSNCKDLKTTSDVIGARLISSIISYDLQQARGLFADINNEKVIDIYFPTIRVINYLLLKLSKDDDAPDMIPSDGDLALTKALLNTYANGESKQTDILKNILCKSCSVRACLKQVIEDYFGEGSADYLWDDV